MTRVYAKLLGPCFKTGQADTYHCTTTTMKYTEDQPKRKTAQYI